MAKLTSTAADKTKTADDITASVMQNIAITTNPVVITAVQRKANIGNFETIDIYMAIAMPLENIDTVDQSALNDALIAAASQGFSVASKETADRYHMIKDSLK